MWTCFPVVLQFGIDLVFVGAIVTFRAGTSCGVDKFPEGLIEQNSVDHATPVTVKRDVDRCNDESSNF